MIFKHRNIGLLLYFFRPYTISALGVFLWMVFSGLAESLTAAALYPVLNNGLALADKGIFMQKFNIFLRSFLGERYFFGSCLVLITFAFSTMCIKMKYLHKKNTLVTNIMGNVQKSIFEKYQKLDYEYFSNHKQGKMLHIGAVSPVHISQIILLTISCLHDFISAIFLFCLLALLSLKGTLFFIALVALYVCMIRKINKMVLSKSAASRINENIKKNVILNEFITGVKTIRAFFVQKAWKKKYQLAVDRSMQYNLQTLMGRECPDVVMRAVYFILLAIIGIYMSFRKKIEFMPLVPMLGTLAMVATTVIPTVQRIGKNIMAIMNAITNMDITHDLLNTRTVPANSQSNEFSGFSSAIQFNNVSFKYPEEQDNTLNNVTLSFSKNKTTALVGKSGSGKTTIINLLLKFYNPDKGTITIDDKNLIHIKNESYLTKLGYISQEAFLYNDTVAENIIFGMPGCTEKMVRNAACMANANEFIVNMPKGYETNVGDVGVKLSAGQRQRIAIARAVLRKPELLIMDEGTSSLDIISEQRILDAVNKLSHTTTIILVAHRLSTVQHADKIFVINEGAVVQLGTHEELFSQKGIYQDLYSGQHM